MGSNISTPETVEDLRHGQNWVDHMDHQASIRTLRYSECILPSAASVVHVVVEYAFGHAELDAQKQIWTLSERVLEGVGINMSEAAQFANIVVNDADCRIV